VAKAVDAQDQQGSKDHLQGYSCYVAVMLRSGKQMFGSKRARRAYIPDCTEDYGLQAARCMAEATGSRAARIL